MKEQRHMIGMRITTRTRDMLQALADERGGIGLGRVAADLLDAVLDGKAGLATRSKGGAITAPAIAQAQREQSARVLASLRAAVAERDRTRQEKEGCPHG